MNPIATRLLVPTAPSTSRDLVRVAATLLVGAAMGAILATAVLTQLRPAAATPAGGVAVTDGWAHSPITRLGISGPATGVGVADGWAHSPITRLGSVYNANAGVAVTDGWAHSPITREGASDARSALLRSLAASYERQGPAAEARAR